jgi:hypothetical protein
VGRRADGVKSLKQALGKLEHDIGVVEKAVVTTKDEIKPVKEELKTSDEILLKSANAYKLFGQRVQQSREKANLARQQVNALDQGAMLAQQYATQMRAKAVDERDKKAAELLAQEASEADAKVDMLKKQSAEAMQSAQLFDAEADEAASYMSMFGADAQQAQMRQAHIRKSTRFNALVLETPCGPDLFSCRGTHKLTGQRRTQAAVPVGRVRQRRGARAGGQREEGHARGAAPGGRAGAGCGRGADQGRRGCYTHWRASHGSHRYLNI